jgi:hypothetical protein
MPVVSETPACSHAARNVAPAVMASTIFFWTSAVNLVGLPAMSTPFSSAGERPSSLRGFLPLAPALILPATSLGEKAYQPPGRPADIAEIFFLCNLKLYCGECQGLGVPRKIMTASIMTASAPLAAKP